MSRPDTVTAIADEEIPLGATIAVTHGRARTIRPPCNDSDCADCFHHGVPIVTANPVPCECEVICAEYPNCGPIPRPTSATKAVGFSDVRCTLCGGARQRHEDGTPGACSFLGCSDPLHDLRATSATDREDKVVSIPKMAAILRQRASDYGADPRYADGIEMAAVWVETGAALAAPDRPSDAPPVCRLVTNGEGDAEIRIGAAGWIVTAEEVEAAQDFVDAVAHEIRRPDYAPPCQHDGVGDVVQIQCVEDACLAWCMSCGAMRGYAKDGWTSPKRSTDHG